MAVRERLEKASRAVRRNRAVIAAGVGATGVLSLLAAGDASVTGCGEFSWEGSPTFNVPTSADGVANEDLIPGQVILYDGGARDDGKHSFGFNTNLITPTSKTVFVNLVASDDLWKEGGSTTNARVDFRGPSRGMVRLQSTLRSLDGKGKFDEANRLAIDINRLEEVMKYHPEATVLIMRESVPHGNGIITDRTYNISQATIDQLKARKAVICAATTPTRVPDTSTPIPPSPTPSRTPVPATPTSTPRPPEATASSTPVQPTSTPTREPVIVTTPSSTPKPPEATASSTPVPPISTPTRQAEAPTASPTAERVRTLIPLPADGKARAVNRVIGEPVKLENPNFTAGDPEANFRIGVEYGRFVIISSGGIKIADEDKQVSTDTIILTVVDGGRSQTEVDTYDFKVPNTYGIALTATKSLPNERLVNPNAQNQAALEEMLGQLITLLKEELGRGRTKAIINYYDGANRVFDQLKINDISAFIASIEDTSTPIPPSPTPSRTPVPATPTSTPRPPEATASSTPVPPISTPTREPVIVTTPSSTPKPPEATATATSTPEKRVRSQIPLPADGKARAVNRIIGVPRRLGNPNIEDGNPDSTFRENVRNGEFVIISSGGIKVADEDKQVGTDTIIFTVLDGDASYDIKVPDNYAMALTAQKSLPNERLINPAAQNQTALEELHGQLLTLAKEELKRGRTKMIINYYDGRNSLFHQSEFNISDYLAIEDTTPLTPTPTVPVTPVSQMMERLRLPIVINGISNIENPRPTQTSTPTPKPDAFDTLQLIPIVSGVCEANRENASWPLDSDKRSRGDLTTYFLDVAEDEVIMLSLGYIRIAGRELTLSAGATDTKYYVFLDGRQGGPTRYEFEAFDEYGRVTSISKSVAGRPILQDIESLREWYNSMVPYARLDLERNGIKQLRTIVYQGGTDGTLARRPIGTESFLSGVRPCS